MPHPKVEKNMGAGGKSPPQQKLQKLVFIYFVVKQRSQKSVSMLVSGNLSTSLTIYRFLLLFSEKKKRMVTQIDEI